MNYLLSVLAVVVGLFFTGGCAMAYGIASPRWKVPSAALLYLVASAEFGTAWWLWMHP